LPRGGYYPGECPGAAAITIINFLFSSPRVSPNGDQDAEFETPHSTPGGGTNFTFKCGMKNSTSRCGIENSASRSAFTGLPVINRQALHRSSFVPLDKGDEIRYGESGGKDDKNLIQQGVNETPRSSRTKGFKSERRYAYVLN
jgi:hypothetical protein